MSRSKWKPPFIDNSLFRKLNLENEKKKIISTWSRRSTIYPATVGLQISIHNGKEMITREIKPQMVGHKLGDFVFTRKNFVQKKKGKNIIKKK